MKKIFFVLTFCLLGFLDGIVAQTLTFISKLNAQLIYYVDGTMIEGSSTLISEGNHSIEAKYINGSVAISDKIYVPLKGFNYTITPPDVNILIKRTVKRDNCTQGELYVNGTLFCNTLELIFRNNENNISSIAVGSYNAHVGYTNNYPNGVIILDNVRSNVYYLDENGYWKTKIVDRNENEPIEIHSGNIPGHSKGCILIGNDYSAADDCFIVDSRNTIKKLYGDYLDTNAQGKLNAYIKITVKIELDY